MSSRRKKKRVVKQVESVAHASAVSSVIRKLSYTELGDEGYSSCDFHTTVILHDVKSDIRIKTEEGQNRPTVVVTTGWLFDKWLPAQLDFYMEKVRGHHRHIRRYNRNRPASNEQYLLLDSLWRMIETKDWGIRYDSSLKDKLPGVRRDSTRNFRSRRYTSIADSKKRQREYTEYFEKRNLARYNNDVKWEHNEVYDKMVIHNMSNLVAMNYGVDKGFDAHVSSVIEAQCKEGQTRGYYLNGGFGDNVSYEHSLEHSALVAEILEVKALLDNSRYKRGAYKMKGGKTNA